MALRRIRFGRIRHSQLLAALALLMIGHPFVEGSYAALASDVLLLVIFFSTILAYSDRRTHLLIGVLLIVAVQATAVYREIQGVEQVSVTYSLLAMSFFVYFCGLILRSVFRARDVSIETIAGALSAYLLIGVIFAFAYALLESQVPGSIVGLRARVGDSGYAQYLSYSFVTLTTLGYGNVVPGNARADALAMAEAVLGQFYLTVLVARLVAMSLSEGRAAEPERIEVASDSNAAGNAARNAARNAAKEKTGEKAAEKTGETK